MTNVTYLIGAGASAGKRGENGFFLEGLPCVNEISKCLWDICSLIDHTSIPNNLEWMVPQIGLASIADWESARKSLWRRLQRLYIHCERNATIDTYAKKLVLKKRQNEFKELEQLLALFFIYLQLQNYPDTRYDTFLANILDTNLHFPPNIRVISWNYDSQFEIAYSEYNDDDELLVGDKNAKLDSDYEIIKINGTATFDNLEKISTLRKIIWDKIWKIKEDTPDSSIHMQREQVWLLEFIYLYQLYVYGKTDNTNLSFAFDNSQPSKKILDSVEKIISRTDALVIIGYTFPYFNRGIDRRMLQNISPYTKVYIQDLSYERIKQSLKAVLPNLMDGQIFPQNDVSQFFLPPEL